MLQYWGTEGGNFPILCSLMEERESGNRTTKNDQRGKQESTEFQKAGEENVSNRREIRCVNTSNRPNKIRTETKTMERTTSKLL